MDENTTKLIKERFDTLPAMIQEVILSSHYEETLIEIGKQYNLNVEQLGILEQETTLIMMGLTPTKDFETELTRELNVDKTKGTQIVKDVNEKIFFRIRELLKIMNTPTGEKPSLEEEIKKEEQKPTSTRSSLGGDDTQILDSAGIQIIPANAKEPARPPEWSGAGGEKLKEDVHNILTQKLSIPVQSGMAKTEHTLDNITKTTPSNPYPPKGDPYRLPPE